MLMTGCSGAGGMVPISDQMVSTTTGAMTSQLGYITDASAMKEKFVHDSLQNRDKMIAMAHTTDGFHMSFELVEVAPGVKALLPKDISYKEQARFDQVLPTAPSIHPGWKTAEVLGKAAINGTVIGLGINAASDIISEGIAASRSNVNTNTTTTSIDNSVGPVDSSRVNTITDNSSVDNSVGPVDNSWADNSSRPVDNSVGPVDNSIGPVDNTNNSTVPIVE